MTVSCADGSRVLPLSACTEAVVLGPACGDRSGVIPGALPPRRKQLFSFCFLLTTPLGVMHPWFQT